MIVVASGHPGIDRFVLEARPEGVETTASWTWVESRWDQIGRLLVGEHLADFGKALQWMVNHRDKLQAVQIVLWVGNDWVSPENLERIPQINIWRGELDASRLIEWWSHVYPEQSLLDLDRCWLVQSVFPYLPPMPLVEALTTWADRAYGPRGGWVDMAWHSAELSLMWLPDLYQRREFPFDKLRVRRAQGHALVPAPPPWLPGQSAPEPRDLQFLMHQGWSWQGWYLGSQIATPWALELVAQIPAIVLWADHSTPVPVLERTEQLLKVYRTDIQLVIAVTGHADKLRSSVPARWHVWAVDEPALSPQRTERRPFFNLSRRKKE